MNFVSSLNSLVKKISSGPIVVIGAVILGGGAITAVYYYQRGAGANISYKSNTASSSGVNLVSPNISADDWQKLLSSVAGTSSLESATLTQSDVLSREVFARFVAAKQAGQDVTPEMAKQIAADIIAYADSVDQPAVLYQSTDLKITADNQTTASAYKQQIDKILLAEPSVGNEMVIMQEALVNNNLNNIAKLKNIADVYKKIATKLITVPVPRPIANDHLKLVNFYIKIAKNVSTFAYIKTDPFVATRNFNEYAGEIQSFGATVDVIKGYLSAYNLDL